LYLLVVFATALFALDDEYVKKFKLNKRWKRVLWLMGSFTFLPMAVFVLRAPFFIVREVRKFIMGNDNILKGESRKRYERIFAYAVKVFEDEESAREWFHSSHMVLGNRKPIDMMNSDEEAQEAEDVLGRIEYGVYS